MMLQYTGTPISESTITILFKHIFFNNKLFVKTAKVEKDKSFNPLIKRYVAKKTGSKLKRSLR